MTAKKQIDRPDFAYVGNHCYRIEWLTEDEWTGQRLDLDDQAQTWSARQLILMRLAPDAQESLYQETLLHELTHAVWDATALTHVKMTEPADPEEFIIALQTPALLFILKMNPQLTPWLLSDGTVVR